MWPTRNETPFRRSCPFAITMPWRSRIALTSAPASTPFGECTAVTAITSPQGIDAGKIVKAMRERHGMVIANGQDRLKGVSFRVGHMGAYDAADILAVVGALEDALSVAGFEVEPGTGVASAQRSFAGTKVPA